MVLWRNGTAPDLCCSSHSLGLQCLTTNTYWVNHHCTVTTSCQQRYCSMNWHHGIPIPISQSAFITEYRCTIIIECDNYLSSTSAVAYCKTLIFCVRPISHILRVAKNREIKFPRKFGFTVAFCGCFHCNLAAENSSVNNTSPGDC